MTYWLSWEANIFQSATSSYRKWIEVAALGSLAGVFAIFSIYTPQGIDVFAVAFFLFGSLLIEQADIDASGWTGQRPFVFACGAVLLAMSFASGACSVNGFKAQIGSGVYIAIAPAALFLVASKARFHLVGERGVKRLILAAIFVGLVPAAVYGIVTFGQRYSGVTLPGQPAPNIAAVFLSIVSAITLHLTIDASRRARLLAYLAVCALLILGLLTMSRTFLVSTIIMLAVYGFTIRKRGDLQREILPVLGVIAVILIVSFFAFPSGVAKLFNPPASGFFDGRLQTWADGWELFRRYPLCGIGPHTFYDPKLNPLYVERTQAGVDFYPFYHAHDVYLNTLAEGGVIMGAWLVVLIAAAVYGCYVLLKRDPENRFGTIALTLLAMFLLIGLFENTMVRPLIFLFPISLGLAMNVTWRDSFRARQPD